MKRVKKPYQNSNSQLAEIKPGAPRAWLRSMLKKASKPAGVSLLAFVFIAASVLSMTSTASAAVKYTGSIETKASIYESALILQRCLVGKVGMVSEAEVKKGNVLGETNGNRSVIWDKTIINYHQTLRVDDNVMNCSEYDNALVKGAINRLKIDPVDFVCSLGGERRDFNECTGGIGDFKYAAQNGQGYSDAGLIKYLKDKIGIDLNNPGDEVRYWRSYNIVSNYCASDTSVSKSVWDKEANNNKYHLKDPKTGADVYLLASSKRDEKPKYLGKEQGDVNCGTYANRVDQYQQAFNDYRELLTDEEKAAEDTAIDNVQNPPGTEEGTTACAIEGIGWIVCPIAGFIGGLNDGLWGILQNFLKIESSMFDVNSDTYRTWGNVRSIANVAFVIVFIFIIYSQLTGMGVSNYGVKKMLPRLIIAAILVNLSFIICTIAVDISNILGYSIHNILSSFANDASTNVNPGGIINSGGESTAWRDVTAWLVAGGGTALIGTTAVVALGTYGLWGALALLLPTAVAALLAFLMVVVLLIARQAFVIILTVLAPLAFVAYLLPNTSQWFDRWRKFFMTLLIMFPSVALLFGGAELAANIIRAADPANGLLIIASLAITALPLFALPAIMQAAGGIMNRIAGVVNNPNRGPLDKLKRGGEAFSKRRGGQRSIQAFNSQGKMFGRKRLQKNARQDAIDAGIDREVGRSKNQYIASQLQTDSDGNAVNKKFAEQVAGGSAGRYGPSADADAITRALASAKLTIDKATAEEVEAESVMVRNFNQKQLTDGLSSGKLSDSQHAARLQRLVKIADPEDYAEHIDSAMKSKSETIRGSAARALASDGPKWFKGSDLDAIGTGAAGNEGKTFESITRANIKAGVMSPEKIVEETSGNLGYAMRATSKHQDPITGVNEAQRLVDAAAAAKMSPTLSIKIKHNVQAIDSIASGKTPELPTQQKQPSTPKPNSIPKP